LGWGWLGKVDYFYNCDRQNDRIKQKRQPTEKLMLGYFFSMSLERIFINGFILDIDPNA